MNVTTLPASRQRKMQHESRSGGRTASRENSYPVDDYAVDGANALQPQTRPQVTTKPQVKPPAKQPVQQPAPAGIGQGLEKQVGVVALCHVIYASNCLPE